MVVPRQEVQFVEPSATTTSRTRTVTPDHQNPRARTRGIFRHPSCQNTRFASEYKNGWTLLLTVSKNIYQAPGVRYDGCRRADNTSHCSGMWQCSVSTVFIAGSTLSFPTASSHVAVPRQSSIRTG